VPHDVAAQAHQEGVLSRPQVLAAGLDDDHIERRLRRREWARVHRGVYVDHTGPLTREQRWWAALLFYAPACLAGETALVAHGLRQGSATDVVQVAVAEHRRVTKLPGVQVHRLTTFDTAVHPSRTIPVIRLEQALLTVAARMSSTAGAVALLGDACQMRRTTPERLALALGALHRLPRRRLLFEVLADVGTGAYSALEHAYLVRVERPHGLPTGARQRRVLLGPSAAYRDVEYVGTGLVVELDGRLGHERARDRWSDLDRDLRTAVGGDVTVRLAWEQVLDPCRTAAAISTLLVARGWRGTLQSCGPTCEVGLPGGLSA
jgi:hypothetical protein